jgi:hypothetical protein
VGRGPRRLWPLASMTQVSRVKSGAYVPVWSGVGLSSMPQAYPAARRQHTVGNDGFGPPCRPVENNRYGHLGQWDHAYQLACAAEEP